MKHNATDVISSLSRQLSAAPHRLMFFAGALAVIVSMLWWALVLHAARFGWAIPLAPVQPGWAHAVLGIYGMFGPFIFGFLLTVFPRWLERPELTRRHYVPVFGGVFGGYLLCHVGLLGNTSLLIAGLVLMLGGWIAGLITLGRVLALSKRDAYANSVYGAALIGAIGLASYLLHVINGTPGLAYVAIQLGLFGFLLPVYFSVCHRMIPFFSSSKVPGYRIVRPDWSLPLLWILLILRVGLASFDAVGGLCAIDAALALFFAAHWLAWQPWKAYAHGLLAVLHLAFLWLPIAFVLFVAQEVVWIRDGSAILGRAPQHALTVGFFGSMLVAMVTRVTQGHSGRPLDMGVVPWICFVALQLVAVLRIAAEFATDQALWLAVAACGWLLAFLPWVLRSLWIYLRPRADGKAG
ncbi:MAG: NnrS family protein [Tahibacter sp.]